MNHKVSRKSHVSHPPQSKLSKEVYDGNAELQEWRLRIGTLATLFCSNVQSLLWQAEAARYSSGIPETEELMQSALSEMETLTWSMYDLLKTSTYGSQAWNKISQNEREVLNEWMLAAYEVLRTSNEE